MVELNVTHHIQKYILGKLNHHKTVRFTDLKKPGVETNLFSYHLKLLVRQDFVRKTDGGYSLGSNGLRYVDRVSDDKFIVRTQPKIVTMLVVQNFVGDVLLWKRNKQPYIDTWTVPYGKLHIDDTSIAAAAIREAREKLGIHQSTVRHAGDCYVRVRGDNDVISSTLMHVFRFDSDEIAMNDRLTWARPHKLSMFDLAPAVEQIITRCFYNDPYFFEEFEVQQ